MSNDDRLYDDRHPDKRWEEEEQRDIFEIYHQSVQGGFISFIKTWQIYKYACRFMFPNLLIKKTLKAQYSRISKRSFSCTHRCWKYRDLPTEQLLHQQCTEVSSGHTEVEPQSKTHCNISAFNMLIKLITVFLNHMKGELKNEETKEGQNQEKQWFELSVKHQQYTLCSHSRSKGRNKVHVHH